MRLISFALTADQVLAQEKTVTRRLGWRWLRAGTLLRGVRKAMGLKKGEKPVTLVMIRVKDVRRERLDAIDQADVVREGFPHMTPAQFVAMFCEHMGCTPETEVTRIEFEYVEAVDGDELSRRDVDRRSSAPQGRRAARRVHRRRAGAGTR